MIKRILTLIPTVLMILGGSASALTLEEAIAIGKERSLQLQSPRIDRMKIDGQIKEAWSNALPQIEGTVAYQHYWKPPVVFFPDQNNPGQYMAIQMQQNNGAIADATLTQPLLTFGRVGSGLKAAYAARRSNEHFVENTARTVELEVMKRFWSVLLLRDVVEARRSSLAISDSSLSRVQRMRDVGLMSDYDVLRVKVQASNQIPLLHQAENNLQLTELSLKEYLGVSLDTTVAITGALSGFSIPIGPDTSLARALRRDDLEALRELSGMYNNIYKVYRSQRWPILSGQVKYSWQWSNDKWAIDPKNNASSVYGGLALVIPIWTSGHNDGVAQQHKADWRRSQLQLEQAERGARLQYEMALDSYQTAISSEAAAELAVTQAQEARSIAETKLAQGQITPLEMDAAQLDELVARVALAQAKYDHLVAAAEVRMASGLTPYSK
jgi:outer membrane protein